MVIMVTEGKENRQGTCYRAYIRILVLVVRRAKSDSTSLENLRSGIMDSRHDLGEYVCDMTKNPGVHKSRNMSFRYLFAVRKMGDKVVHCE